MSPLIPIGSLNLRQVRPHSASAWTSTLVTRKATSRRSSSARSAIAGSRVKPRPASNAASASFASVLGGYDNTANAYAATVAGGFEANVGVTAGMYSFVAGGYRNSAQGSTSFAAGDLANADQNGCFVFSDSTGCGQKCVVNGTAAANARP